MTLSSDSAALLDAAPGKFCDLEHGRCHYVYNVCEKPVSDVTLVLVHGFCGSHVYFHELAQRLAVNQNVLRFDLYGRGFTTSAPETRRTCCARNRKSKPPEFRMTTNLFVQQLDELLTHLGETTVDLIGYSMGGGIALSFASQHPAKVRNLCLLAPVGFPSMRTALPKQLPRLLSVPGVATIIGWTLVRGVKTRSLYGKEWLSGDEDRLKAIHDAELRRFPRESSSLARSATNSLRWFSWGEIGSHGTSPFSGPVLVIWGAADRTVPEAGSEAKAFLPQAELLIVPEHGHALPLQKPDMVADALESFIRQQSPTSRL